MALLVFPPNPTNGQLYPLNPLAGQCQYQWEAANNTWRLLGVATGVVPGVYCSSLTTVGRFTIDAVGRVTYAECIDLSGTFVKTNNISAYNNYVWPNADGTPGQVLATNGAGELVWVPGGGGGGGGGVTFVGAGIGLSIQGGGAAITTAGTLNLDPATLTTLGGVIPDGTTITVSPTGVISAVAQPPGLGLAINGSFTKVSIPVLPAPPAPGTGQLQAMPGSLYWDNTLGELFIYYDDGVTSQWISTTGGSSLPPTAGYGLISQSSAYKLAIPISSTAPPAGPSPNQAVPGALYWDNTLGELFVYYDDGVTAQWVSTTGGSSTPPTAGYGLVLQSSAYKNSIPALSSPPTAGVAPNDATDGSMYYDTGLGAMFYRYNDGFSTQWVQI